jgi:transposase
MQSPLQSPLNLHLPTNSSDFNPIEQLWWMRMGSINREQCNTSEELSVEAEAASAVITME